MKLLSLRDCVLATGVFLVVRLADDGPCGSAVTA